MTELQAEIEELENDIDDITAQIEVAEASGSFDPVWRARARAALRYRNRDLFRARAEAVQAAKDAKAQAHFYRMFHMQARGVVSEEAFDRIETRTKEALVNERA